jgi:hypothetical protein
VFAVLSNRRRRYALHHLKQRPDGAVPLGDLSRRVAAWELGVDPEDLTYEDRKSVHTSLSQFHVPKMCDAGLVEFDAEHGIVELTDAGADLDVYLETVRGHEIPWYRYFLLLSVLSGALVVASAVGVPLLASVPGLAVAGLVVAAFLCSSLAFLYDSRYRMRVGNEGPPPEWDA